MAPKIAAFIATLIINIVVAIVILFFMLLAMNGYSESDATWGLVVYGILALLVAVLASAAAVLMTGLMIKKGFGPVVAVLTAVPVISICGVLAEAVCSLIGVGVAEFVRVNY